MTNEISLAPSLQLLKSFKQKGNQLQMVALLLCGVNATGSNGKVCLAPPGLHSHFNQFPCSSKKKVY